MQYSYQLYSSRDCHSWPEALAGLAALGYSQVEGYGDVYQDAPGFRTLLDASGLTMPSGHFPIEELEADLGKVLRIAGIMGMKTIYCPYLEIGKRPACRAGWEAFAARLETIGRAVLAAGHDFGWHNHDFEFAPMNDGGGQIVPMQVILDGAPSIGWEADIAWIIRGGAEPRDWIDRYGDRITAVHIKDLAPDGEAVDEDGWADVGYGTVDWASLLKLIRARTPARLFIMEHDRPSDADRFARRSIDWMRAHQGGAA